MARKTAREAKWGRDKILAHLEVGDQWWGDEKVLKSAVAGLGDQRKPEDLG